jgi:DNA-binding transcriptional regulator YhcF (GntR family)
MKSGLEIDLSSQIPVYKQLIQSIQRLISEGVYQSGEFIPSMNELSSSLAISKETVKKAYSILREKGVIDSAHGKGFYVLTGEKASKVKVLMLFDKLSTYKFVLYRSFTEHIGDHVNVTIHLHNQEVAIFERLLEENLGNFDYYIITPHFPLERKTQDRVLRILKKIPNRKLILLDRNLDALPGNYGSVYQDFGQDAYEGLSQGLSHLKKYKTIQVVSSPGGLYGSFIKESIRQFCQDNQLPFGAHDSVEAKSIKPGNVYIILNSQLDVELIDIIRMAKGKGLSIGHDIGIISYNEAPINEIILDGLTVLSTDFNQMGKLAAEMVMSGKLTKIRAAFGLILRNTL